MSALLKAFTFGKAKHKKLPEDWGESIKQPVNEGMNFYVKYLGSTLVDEPSSESATAAAIKTIIAMAKASGKKLPHVSLLVKPTGLSTTDIVSGEKNLDVSIYRISYCSADATYDRVVAFIATNKNETLECHAFLTSKKKIAQAAALTISQAFTIAFDKWQTIKDKKDAQGNPITMAKKEKKRPDVEPTTMDVEPSLIDLSCENLPSMPTRRPSSLELDFDLDDSFSKLAESRTIPSPGNQNSQNNNSTSATTGSRNPFMLPHNVSVDFQDLPSYFNFEEDKNGKFFKDDSPDDLFSL